MASSSQGEDGANSTKSSNGVITETVQLKKGPWTAAEDALLIEYVNKNGEGNWNAVQRNSGLLRCGKSCRLRWANHLRPNLKKGSFTEEEEQLIFELHSKYGNKWARMASQMPGRTDNEIKNYWNTRMKRHQRAGLAIYPSDMELHHRQHRLPRHRKHHHLHGLKTTERTQMIDFQNKRKMVFCNPVASPSPQPHLQTQPFLFTSYHHQNHQTLNINTIPSHRHHGQFNFFTEHNTNANVSANLMFNPILSNAIAQPVEMKQEVDGSGEFGFVHLLSSDNFPMQSAMVIGSGTNGNSGMLDDVLSSARIGSIENDQQPVKKMKDSPAGDEISIAPVTLKDCGVTTPENSSSGLTSIGLRMEEPVVEINPLDDELTSLLDSFPTASPTPQWYRRGGTTINDSPSDDVRGGLVLHLTDHQQETPAAEAAGSGDIDQVLSLGGSNSMSWHNRLPTTY